MNTELLLEENKKLKRMLEEQQSIIRKKDEDIKELKNKVALLEILHFGPKSEKWTKIDKQQSLLFNEAEDEVFKQNEPEQIESAIEKQELGAYTRRKKNRNQGRKPISPDIPREEVVYDIKDEDKICACGCELTCIGSEDSERIKIKPAEVSVIVEKKLKYACRNCEGIESGRPGVITSKGKKHLISGSIADSSLLAWSINEKYTFGLPLYRQEKRLSYIGAPIPRATLAGLTIRASLECEILYQLMEEHIKSGDIINADETRLQVLKEKGREAQSLSWMWVFTGGPPDKKAVSFRYEPTRSHEVPYDFLKDYEGWLQTDDYEAYNTAIKKLNKSRKQAKKIKRVLCWFHARSKYVKSWKVEKSEHAKEIISTIGKLFELEYLRKDFSLRGFYKHRKNRAEVILEKLKKKLEGLYKSTPPKCELGKAVSYTLSNWDLLILYLEHPLLTPSNNIAENAIRPFVIGRKNWLFSYTPKGARASAVLYSLVESAKLHNLNPYEYLYYIFERLPYAETKEDYIKLLPFNIKPKNIKIKSE